MKRTLALILTLFSLDALAHPVIYQGGTAISSSNMEEYSNNYILYSYSNRWAVGVDAWRFTKNRKSEDQAYLKLNHLLYRKNAENSQGNIYLHAGAGKDFMGGIEGDWESRVLYTSAKYLQFEKTYMTQTRVGFSPMERPFNELQTWFMIQAMTIKGIQDTVLVTPMLRFFYHNVLWEMGSSTRGDWMLNLMVHL